MTGLRPGVRLRSAVDDTEVIVIRAPEPTAVLGCGGHPMMPFGQERTDTLELDPIHAGGTELGKRFAHPDKGIEVLCTKGGKGTLTVDGEPLTIKDAKALPSSD